MPLHTQIVRDGEPLKLRWGGFHVAAMVYAVSVDSGQGPFQNLDHIVQQFEDFEGRDEPVPVTPKDGFDLMDYGVLSMTPLNSADYTLTRSFRFIDVTDGEILELKPGDVLSAGRH